MPWSPEFPTPEGMVPGRVERWDAEAGVGEIVLDDGRQVWAHFSAVEAPPGVLREPRSDARVAVEVERADQDGYRWRAIRVVGSGPGVV